MSTNFPNGIMSYGVPVLGPGGTNVPVTLGSYFFVDSNAGSDSNAGTKAGPLATINAAVGKCTANAGDVIIVNTGHVETLTAAGQLAIDVAGVTIVGLGTGAKRPVVLQDAAAADVDITGANVTIRNILFRASAADVAASIDLDAADCWLDACEWEDEGAGLNYVDVIVGGADTVCDGLKITGCRCIGADAANDGFLNCVGVIDGLQLIGNYIALNVATTEPVVEVSGKSLTNAVVTHNYIQRFNESGIVFVDSDQTDNSGIFAYNVIASDDDDAATPFDVTGASCFENYQMGERGADASGLLLPAVDDNA